VRAGTKDLGCHKDGKILSSLEVLPWPAAADPTSNEGEVRAGNFFCIPVKWEIQFSNRNKQLCLFSNNETLLVGSMDYLIN
jgi:hypothetical protein